MTVFKSNVFKLISLTALLTTSFVSKSSFAKGIYFGAGVGAVTMNEGASRSASYRFIAESPSFYTNDFNYVFLTDTSTNDTSYNMYLGYELSQYFSVELGIVDLGEMSSVYNVVDNEAERSHNTVVFDGERIFKTNRYGYTAALKGSYPLMDDLSLFAKIGNLNGYISETQIDDGELSSQVHGTTQSYSVNKLRDDLHSFYHSVGLEYELSYVNLFAEYQMYSFKLPSNSAYTRRDKFKNFQLGLVYKF